METIDKLSDNLNMLMGELRISAEELSRRIGIPASTIKKIRNHSDANPTLSTLMPLAKYFSLTVSQLIGDEALPASRIKGNYQIESKARSKIPLLKWEEAVNHSSVAKQDRYTVSSDYAYSEQAFALLVEEDNWENLAVGTELIIDPVIKAEHRDFVIVHKAGQKIPALKQVLFDEGNIYLKPVTPVYQITIATPEHTFLGTVVEYKKYLKGI